MEFMSTIIKKDKKIGNIIIGFECNKCKLKQNDKDFHVFEHWITIDDDVHYCPNCTQDVMRILINKVNEYKILIDNAKSGIRQIQSCSVIDPYSDPNNHYCLDKYFENLLDLIDNTEKDINKL